MKTLRYRPFSLDSKPLVGAFFFAGLFVLMGLGSAWYMEHNGHVVTGMDNQVVWGMPHVFAVFLIVAASGALNVASMGSVFGRAAYKPLARLSGLVAMALLMGGLAVLVLDLGRPDRLIVAMTSYNFKSIFAWNIFLYTGLLVITAAYLWTMMERRMNGYTKAAGVVAFLWRLALTTGTGLIFGFLMARQAYDAAVMAPMFIAMSFAFGLAIFFLLMLGLYEGDGRPVGDYIVNRMGKLLGLFVAAVMYFTFVQHATNLYAPEHHGVERFILLDGGAITTLFWVGQVIIGGLIPLVLLFPLGSGKLGRGRVSVASVLVILGGLAQVYVIIVGGQSYPLVLFPGWEVSSSFYDGVVADYHASLPEIGLGIGGIAIAGLIVLVGTKVLDFMPVSLADEEVDPHHS
ncbi:MAG: polysulfide reductase NrfD [Rhodospirillaceae bacterium]|jgi:Ni/Fe-hydrogenase subunit HybB-like protein|nr:polysulfide reductase NrfD [Rhodospirillaceae bacterium]